MQYSVLYAIQCVVRNTVCCTQYRVLYAMSCVVRNAVCCTQCRVLYAMPCFCDRATLPVGLGADGGGLDGTTPAGAAPGVSPGASPPLGGPPPARRHSSGGDELASQTATLTLDGELLVGGPRQRTASGSGTLQCGGEW